MRQLSTTSQFPLRSTQSELKNITPQTTPLPLSQSLQYPDNVFTPTIKTVTKTEPYKHHLAADKNDRMRKYYDLSDIRPSKTIEQVVEFDRLNYHKVTESDGSVTKYYDLSGACQMEPPSPIQALGVNPFPSRFIIRTVPGETSRADGGKSQSQRLNDTAIVLHKTAGNPVPTGQTKS